MSTTTETGQERVRAVIREHIGTEFWTQHSLANALAAAGLLRGDDDLGGLRERVVITLRCTARRTCVGEEPCWCPPDRVLPLHGHSGTCEAARDLLRALTGAGREECPGCHVPDSSLRLREAHNPGCRYRMTHNPTVEAPAKPTRRMRGPNGIEHNEHPACHTDVPPCQPVAEPAPVEDRPPVVGDVIDFIDEHGNEWTRSRRVEAWLAATPAPCRHPGAVAVETVVDHSILTSTGRVVERVTALYCPGCGARIAVPQEVSHG